MKKRFLPIGLFSLFILGISLIFLTPTGSDSKKVDQNDRGAQSIAGAKAYFASIRNNQHTGVLDPKDVITSRKQSEVLANYKSGSAKEFTWEELGPDNMGGRTRSVLFDNQDGQSQTLYAGSVTGGVFKSVNLGSTWSKVNLTSGTANLNVSCMIQDAEGTIYAGTGEGLGSADYTAYGELGYEGGFVGKGIFKSDGNDNFTHVDGTEPFVQGEVTEWAYINDLAINNSGNRMYAATHTGLKYASLPGLDNWSSAVKRQIDSSLVFRTMSVDSVVMCDSISFEGDNYVLHGASDWEVTVTGDDTTNTQSTFSEFIAFEEQGNCYDVKINEDGVLFSVFENKIYVSESGDPGKFVNRSIYPDNPDHARMDNIEWTSNVVITDNQGNVLYEESNSATEESDWHTDYLYDFTGHFDVYPHSIDGGRTEFAIAPSDKNIVYAQVAKGTNPHIGSLVGIYISEDAGQSWRIVAPGGSPALNILGDEYGSNSKYYQGDYCNSIIVFPNNPYRVVAGGINMWYGVKVNETGYFQWAKKSESKAPEAISGGGIYDPFYCHADQHCYVFRPANQSQLFVATDGGIFLTEISANGFAFQSLNKNLNVAQFYSLAISSKLNECVGGAQDIGTVYVSGSLGNTNKGGEDLYRQLSFPSIYPEGTDGSSVAFSTLRFNTFEGDEVPPAVFYSKGPLPDQTQSLSSRARRSETLGFDYSLDFLAGAIGDDRFITPMELWESYDNQNSMVDVLWVADKDYDTGDSIIARSSTFLHPFYHVIDEAVSEGDTLYVKDIITNKLFVGVDDEVYMTLESTQFSLNPEWFLISKRQNAGVDGEVQSLAFSGDANYVWAGTNEGRLFRISNVAFAYDHNTADVESPNCIIATDEIILPGEITQAITSIAVDPRNPEQVLITLGNYGNESYVYYCENALDDEPTFVDVQGNLPQMPVYASILELNTEEAIIGTELGVYVSDDPTSGDWYFASGDIGEIPVMALKQQSIYKGSFISTIVDPVTGQATKEHYYGIQNYGDIYAATHGRGVFKVTMPYVGIEEKPVQVMNDLEFDIYPNPATDEIAVNVNLKNEDVLLNIYDLSGKLVVSQEFNNLLNGEQELNINISSMKKGTYLLQLTSENITGTKKLIVVK